MPFFPSASAFTVDSSTLNDVKGGLYNNTYNISSLSIFYSTPATPLDDVCGDREVLPFVLG